MGYVPNRAARMLKTQQSMLIGIFLTDFSGHFYGDLLYGLKEELNRRDYDLIVCSGHNSHRMIPERALDGAIILDATFSDQELLEYADRGHKLVVLDRELQHANVNQVLLDNKAGSTLAVEYLLSQGLERIYAVSGPDSSYDARQRMRAVMQVIERTDQVNFTEITGAFDKESGYAAGARIADEYDGPAGVFCLNDEMAIGLLDYLQTHTSLLIGEHIHLIGYDNIELSRYVRPRLATIDYSMRKWGALAAEQLLKMIGGQPVESERIYVRLIEGDSVSAQSLGVPLEGFAEFSRTVAAEGAVLLKNDGQVLPLRSGDNVAIFGRTQVNYYRSGTGSGGSVHVAYTTNLLDGLRSKKNFSVNEDLAAVYEQWIGQNPFDNGGGGWAAEPWHQKEMPLSDELVSTARSSSNKAIVVIGRTAGEDQDNADKPGSYLLTEDEIAMLKQVTARFEQTVVVLNVSNIIDMSWLNDESYAHPIPCIIYSWHGGMEGGNAIADVLAGEVTPSGKLTDTIAYSIEDYPSTRNYGNEFTNFYQEDIYVGYRYFETFCPDRVQYAFGYGLSYTTFGLELNGASLTVSEGEQAVAIEVTVTNTGTDYAGQEVVQVYYEAPQGKLGKPAKSLAAFGKTRVLQPGESQRLTVSFPVHSMASYDDAGVTGHASAYVLEAGTYRLYAGTSVKELSAVSLDEQEGYVVEALQVVEQLQEAMAPLDDFTRMKPGARKEDGSYDLVFAEVPKRKIDLAERIETRLPKTLTQTGNQGFKLRDVYDRKASMETFIAQLDDQDLAAIVRGEGMSSPLVTPGTASAFGGVSDSLFSYGIPVACTADGPSGIRMDSGQKATQVAIGTLLAATWNTELVEQLYIMEGRELVSNNVDALLGPGLNIRRSPLNGRNFEYFSEDPLISGVFAAACTRGIMKGGSNATLKHFACNNQEKYRSKVDAVLSERALREIYLKGFEIAVKQGGANSIMTSYNPINGHWAASNYDLNTTILRGEWNFKGIVMTDWWAVMNDVVHGGSPDRKYTNWMVRAQNDLYMVVSNYGAEINAYDDNTLDSLADGSLTRGELQRSAMNICEFIMNAPVFSRKQVIEEKVDTFKANPSLSLEQAQALSDNAQIKPASAGSTLIQVNQAGSYRIIVHIMSPESDLAQSACNVTLNDQFMTTIQTNGTDGNWVKQKLVKVALEAGLYELRLEFVKPGLQIDWIEFKQIYQPKSFFKLRVSNLMFSPLLGAFDYIGLILFNKADGIQKLLEELLGLLDAHSSLIIYIYSCVKRYAAVYCRYSVFWFGGWFLYLRDAKLQGLRLQGAAKSASCQRVDNAFCPIRFARNDPSFSEGMKKLVVIATSAAMLASYASQAGYASASSGVQPASAVLSVAQSKVLASQASVSAFDLYGKESLNAYNAVFKMANTNIKSITNNGGNYSGSPINQAIDGDMTTHWETGKPNSSTFTNEVVFNLNDSATLNRIVYAARQSGARGKGFAQEFEIYSSATDAGNDFTLVTSGAYAGSTGDVVEIKFAPTAFKRIKFVFTKANQDWASAAEFSFYQEDKVRDALNGIFTDGTMSAVVPEYNQVDKINALAEQAQAHPLYPIYKDQLDLAKGLVSGEQQIEGTIIQAEQHGDMKQHAQQNLRFGFGTNNQPTGFAVKPGTTIHVYVDADSADKVPSLIFSQQEGSWSSWARGVSLRPGKNTIVVPEIPADGSYAHEVTKGGTVYIVNPYTPEQQGKAPRIRFEGLEKIPFMTKTTDPEQFKAFLTAYKQRIDQDIAAHPAVKDRQLIDVVEMASDRIIFTGTASEAYKVYVTQGNNPLNTLTGYDAWIKTIFDFYGLDSSSRNHDPKLIRENIRLMQPFGAMYAAGDHTGIQAGTVATMLGDFNKSYPGWGLNHEIGHRLAVGEREYGEVTNNMLSMLMSVAAHSLDTRIPFESEIYKYVLQENNVVMDQQSLFARLGAYWQLELAHPGYWTELNRLYRDRKVSLANGDNSKQQYLVEFSSEVLGLDLSSFFARHGFTVNPETKAKLTKYPASRKLWYLNNSVLDYKGAGIADKGASIKVSVAANAAAKTNTLSFTMDKAYANDLLGYEIYRNDTLVGFTGTEQFVDSTIDPTINYTYRIIGYDKKLNALTPVQVNAFKPTLSVEDQVTVKLGQSFNPLNYVKASSYQGNDITSEVVVKSNNVDVTAKGSYEVVYEVKGGGAVETKTAHVTVTSNYAYLSDLNAKSATVGWNELKKDKAVAGGTITLARQGLAATYAKGIGVHANSEVVYDMEGKGYDFFESYIGIDQAMKGKPSSATFEVYVDGVKKFGSDVFRAGTEHGFVKIPVTGAREIKLVTTDANDGNASDHTEWADAKFTINSSLPSLTVPEELAVVKLNGEFDVRSGIEASDAEDGNLTQQIKVQTNGFNPAKTGTYRAEYSVTDRDGNQVTKSRTIVVYSASKYASDVNWESARTDYNVVRKDKSSSNNTIKLLAGGAVKEFAKGIGTHANSVIVYNLTGTNYEYFETMVGVDHNIAEQNNSSIIFRITADGQEVYNSGLMKYGTEAKLARIPVKGVQQLKLIVEDAGNGNASDHGSFGDARFLILNSAPELTIAKSVSTKVGQPIAVSADYSAVDAEDGNVTSQVVVAGEDRVNFNRAGEYPITYTVTDRDGNTITKTRTIAVVNMEDYKYLTDYDWSSTQNSYTAPKKDISISDKALRLTDAANLEVAYARGIGAHSSSTIVYDLSGKNFDYFSSFVGVDRQMYGSVGSVSFEVYVDGEKKFDSGVMNSRDPQKFAEADINGAKELKLVVTDGGNGNGSDHATWGDTKLHFANGDRLFTGDLDLAVQEAKLLSLEGYTEASSGAFTVSLARAAAVLADKSAPQSEVDAAAAALKSARAGLTRIDLTQVIAVQDSYLRDSIKKTLGVTGEITLGDMYQLTELTSESGRVKSLSGLEYAKNLATLTITGNEVMDFSPLKDLTKLVNLNANPQVIEMRELKGPVIQLDNPVIGVDGNKVIPYSAGIRHNKTFKETMFDVKDWASNPAAFTIDLTNADKGLYTFVMGYTVKGNLVQIMYLIDNG
ncbi:hypothetical protein AXX17_ATUG04160 [Arabidopsis thaliana]|uniref:beta-glucosidase n=1 Tax=Arabidopsis thaliana TaxID=3702 RepID=A0A178U900_ARATH|nr:hypothetical protein AXX17_ATUG04160 [Arabidopsis thaliana]